MPVVRPIGEPGSLGLILPTAPQDEIPVQPGRTTYPTNGDTWGATSPAAALARTCAEAEAAGAGALWAVDHLFWPRPMLECLSALAVAATATERAVLGSCVLQLPLRRSAVVAKQAATLEALAPGRVVLGVGVGSHRGEYDAAGVDFSARGALLDDGIAQLHEAWARAGTAGPYRLAPSSGPLPLWIGGSGPAARRRAATVGDGWVPMFMAPEAYGEALGGLRAAAAAAGRPPGAVTAAVVVMASVGPGADVAPRGARWLSSLYGITPRAFERHLVAGTPGACAEQIARYRAAGADHVVVMITDDRPVEGFAELVRALGAETDLTTPPGGSRTDLVEVPT